VSEEKDEGASEAERFHAALNVSGHIFMASWNVSEGKPNALNSHW